MKIKYQIIERENLLIQKFIGVFSLEFYKKFSRFIIEKLVSKPIEKVLIDFRELSFDDLTNYIPDDYYEKIEKIVEFRKNINQNELKNKNVKMVIWVDKPLHTVVAHLFIGNFPSMNYNYCSTLSNITNILELPEYLTNLDNMVHNLESEFKID